MKQHRATGWVIFEWTRQRTQELEQRRKPPPVESVWVRGSMEWLAEQEKERSQPQRLPRALSSVL